MNLILHPISVTILFAVSLAGVVAVLVMPGSQILAAALFGAASGFFGSSLYEMLPKKKLFF